MRVDVTVPPSLLTRTASNMITPDLNVSLRPTIEPRKIALCTDINPDSAGGSTCHHNAVAGLEHVNRIASPGHATLVLDTNEASIEMEHSITHVAQSLL